MGKKGILAGVGSSQKVIKDSVKYSVILQILIKAKGIISLPLITFFLLPSELGVWKIITASATIFPPLLTLNLIDGGAIFFCETSDKAKIKQMYSTLFNFIALISVPATAAMVLAVKLFKPGMMGYVAYVILLTMVTILDQFSGFLYIVYQKNKVFTGYKLFKEYVGLGITILMIAINTGYRGAIIGYCVVVFSVSLVLLYNTFTEIGYEFKIRACYLKKFLPTSLTLLPVFSMTWIITSIDSFFIAYYRGKDAVGIYSVAYSISAIVLFLSESLNYFWFPLVTRLMNESLQKFSLYFKKIFRFGLYVGSACIIAMTISSRFLVGLFSNKNYIQAADILGLITIAYTSQIFIKIFTAPIYSSKRPELILMSNVIGAVINIILNFTLIPPFGILGAAVSTAVSFISVAVSLWITVEYKIGMKAADMETVCLLIFTTVLFIGLNYVNFMSSILQVCMSMLAAIFYLVFWYIKLDAYDKGHISGYLSRYIPIFKVQAEKGN